MTLLEVSRGRGGRGQSLWAGLWAEEPELPPGAVGPGWHSHPRGVTALGQHHRQTRSRGSPLPLATRFR